MTTVLTRKSVLYLGQSSRKSPHDIRFLSALADRFDFKANADVVLEPVTDSVGEREPFIAISWGSDLLTGDPGRFSAQLHAAAAVIVDTEAGERIATELGAKKVVRFPYGVDLEYWTPTDRQSRRKVALFCPRVNGASYVERARRIYEGCEYVARLPMGMSQGQMKQGYNLAGVYVTGAPCDGSSVCLLEAMASGLPVVVPDNPGNREWVSDGEHGYLYPAGDVASLAAKLQLVVENGPAWRHEVGQRNRALVEAKADWSAHKETFLNLVEEVAA